MSALPALQTLMHQQQVTRFQTASATLDQMDQTAARVFCVWLANTRLLQVMQRALTVVQVNIPPQLVRHTTHARNAWPTQTHLKPVTNRVIALATLA